MTEAVLDYDSLEMKRKRRCYHRVISGIEKGGEFRFVTLTSSPQSINTIQKDLRRLWQKLKYLNILKGYIRCIEYTKSGLEHAHIIMRSSYVEQQLLSKIWDTIHQAPIIDIRKVAKSDKSAQKAASYLAKYMSKEGHRRYSWNWTWVYRGFVKTWKESLKQYRVLQNIDIKRYTFIKFLGLWQTHLKMNSPPGQFLNVISFFQNLAKYQTNRDLLTAIVK